MTVLCPAVQTLVQEMPYGKAHFTSGCSRGFQLVGDHATGTQTLPFQESGQKTPILMPEITDGLFIRTVGITRAMLRIGLADIVYNMRRFLFLKRIKDSA